MTTTGQGSTTRHDFSRVPRAEIPRSSFDRSHSVKTTFNAGFLVPMFVEEVLPGDTMSLNMTGFGRLATPTTPFMDNMFYDTFFFFVPNRLVWDNWQRFNGEQDNPEDSTDYLVPQVVAPAGGFAEGSIEDYFGIPIGVANLSVSALWHRALNLIFNEWFRDQNLQQSLPVPKNDGPDDPTQYKLFKRGKRHDYFTSCLPWPQKGPAVPLPLTGNAPVKGLALDTSSIYNQTPGASWRESGSGATPPTGSNWTTISGNNPWSIQGDNTTKEPAILADLSTVTAATINSLRQAWQIQKLLERDARGGTRYTEIVRAHFGVVSPDARLQRPEYLGGGSSPINVNPIAQTSATDQAVTPQGNLAAMATVQSRGHGFTKSFTEHGVLIGLMCVRADLHYQYGLNRMWSRRSRYDYYWPALSHIGEQAVLNKEIYAQGTAADDDVFGYQERYAEYRYKPSVITGKFRSTAAQPLDIWHLAQKFDSLPTLSADFIEENPPVERVIAVQNEDHLKFDGWFQFRCARPMPMYGVPGLVDHF